MKFKEYSFRSLLSEIIDNRGKTVPTAEEGIPLIATNCIKNETLYPSYDKARYVSENTYKTWFRGHPKPGDMVFTCKGSPGRVCWVPDPIDFCIAQDMVGIRANEKIVYPKYLFALLRSEETQNKILNMHVGSLIPHFKKGDFGNLYFDIPLDMEYQRKVGDTYFDFCLKIESNRQTNQTLEQIAQALFKSWFVDFEPTHAKIAAKEAGASPEEIEHAAMCAISGKTPDQLAQNHPKTITKLKATAALFPGVLVDSTLGKIPEGWVVNNLKSVTTEIRRGISPAYVDENGVCVINQKCIRNHKIDFSFSRLNDPIKKKVEDRLLQVGDVLVNSTGVGTLGRLAPIRYLAVPTAHDSHVTVVRANTSEISRSFLIGLMLENETFIKASGIGSTGQTELNRQVLENISFAKPTLALSLFFESIVEPMNHQIAIFEQQESSLSKTRDNLLPKLLSNELEAGNVN
ncbi:restriction endonuclease subunit S [Undibacterium amnicola]|uniref:Restriction endonuclease subunit S n=1 Tax=Undibacterium amnicola TaxID=1834038 RepID=A0ABR6XQG1_9BURK|nr:restriction endonuclease subunit S [Undibacterium amnicola]MBC3831732.1 restriction endonuclease subunit S [Undibacterium amnicola]